MKEFGEFVSGLYETPLQAIRTHDNNLAGYKDVADIVRFFSERPIYTAVHIVKDAKEVNREYGILHTHPFPEVNILAAPPGELVYRIGLGEEEQEISSPAVIFIPKGLKHSANLLRGKGAFVVLRLNPEQTYQTEK